MASLYFFFIAANGVGRLANSGKEWRLAVGERNFHLKAIEMIHILFDMRKAYCSSFSACRLFFNPRKSQLNIFGEYLHREICAVVVVAAFAFASASIVV